MSFSQVNLYFRTAAYFLMLSRTLALRLESLSNMASTVGKYIISKLTSISLEFPAFILSIACFFLLLGFLNYSLVKLFMFFTNSSIITRTARLFLGY